MFPSMLLSALGVMLILQIKTTSIGSAVIAWLRVSQQMFWKEGLVGLFGPLTSATLWHWVPQWTMFGKPGMQLNPRGPGRSTGDFLRTSGPSGPLHPVVWLRPGRRLGLKAAAGSQPTTLMTVWAMLIVEWTLVSSLFNQALGRLRPQSSSAS